MGVLFHEIQIANLVNSTDLNNPAAADLDVECLHQISNHILDRNWLRTCLDPARSDHHWELLNQGPDHLEGSAARPDDD